MDHKQVIAKREFCLSDFCNNGKKIKRYFLLMC